LPLDFPSTWSLFLSEEYKGGVKNCQIFSKKELP
jgi:hypothetical protein